jgi:hypothetical protein
LKRKYDRKIKFGRVANGNTEFHGTTVSWVALKEKEFI